jgi:hypothetical protein
MAAMIAGLAAMTYVRGYTSIAWTWYVLIGTSLTFLTGILAALFIREGFDGRKATGRA